MNFLQLCQRLRQEAAISGTGPTTTVAQTGEYKKIVDWILSAYEDIQNLHSEWDFLRTDLTFQTISGTNNYTKAAISADEYGEWVDESFRSYLTSGGSTGEQFMAWLDWTDFRDSYVFGSNRDQVGIPRYLTRKPDTSLVIFPTPDGEYTINGEYFKRAQTMTANADEPLIPSKYHMIIVWRALMYYGGQSNAPELYAIGTNEYKRLLHKLESSQLQPIRLAGPMA